MSGYNNPALLLHFDGFEDGAPTGASPGLKDFSLNNYVMSVTGANPTTQPIRIYGPPLVAYGSGFNPVNNWGLLLTEGPNGGVGPTYVATPTITAGSPLDLTSNDFTVEMQCNGGQVTNATLIFADWSNGNTAGCTLGKAADSVTPYSGGYPQVVIYKSGSVAATITSSTTTNQQDFYAVVRQGSTFTLYVNGNSVGTATVTGSLGTPGGQMRFGGIAGTTANGANIDEVRVTNGTALYTSNYTIVAPFLNPIVPTQNYQGSTQPSLLLHMTGANGSTTFVDSSLNNFAPVFFGPVTLSTSVYKFSPSSAYFSGGNNVIAFTPTSGGPLDLMSSDWTIEFQIYPTTSAQNSCIFCNTGYGQPGFYIVFNTGYICFQSPPAISPTICAVNVWTAIAIVRSGGNLYIYQNGTRVKSDCVVPGGVPASYTNYNFGNATGPIAIGNSMQFPSINVFVGYMDEIRITKSALYTGATYPVQTDRFPNPSLSIVSSNFSVVPQALTPIKAPNLQVPPLEYSQKQQKDLTNQLKIYFNAVDNANHQFIQKSGSVQVGNWVGSEL